ncbi:MAG: hypothetical protein ABL958_04305 [Bdellovibrionia bacterium]
MSWLAVCTSFGEEYSVIQSKMVEREDVADGRDARSCRGLFQDTPIELIMMGIGEKGVGRLQRLDWSDYMGFLHLGYCGGLDSSLEVGDLIFPERCLNLEGESLEFETLHLLLKAPKKVSPGVILTSDRLIRTQSEKAKLFESTGAAAVDMESFLLVKAAQEKGLSAVVLKAVADSRADELPEFGPPFDEESLRKGKVNAPDLTRRWRENMDQARLSLAMAADQLVPALHQIWSF